MPQYSLKEAIEKRLKDFTTYLASFLSAMLVYKAVNETVGESRRLSVTWLIAFLALTASVGVLVLVTYLDQNDVEM
jgi:hypothetical protein